MSANRLFLSDTNEPKRIRWYDFLVSKSQKQHHRMASKQLGKLRQWAGEIVSSNKTTVSEDFKTLEKDVELRLIG